MTKVKRRGRSIQTLAAEAIRSNLNNYDAAEFVCRLESSARTTWKTIAWYRSKMKRSGEAVPKSARLAA